MLTRLDLVFMVGSKSSSKTTSAITIGESLRDAYFKIKVINWVSLEVGTVKSESYRENGKFLSKIELIELSR